ncbi:MAG: ABC transporter ATP-binding protein [Ilumatobacteraceae bacterium]
MSSLLEIDGLVVRLPVGGAMRPVLRGVDLRLDAGEALGLVGESGSGKSMTARAIDRLLPAGAAVDGAIRFDGADVASLRGNDLRRFRREVSMIFQDPRSHINPVRRIGDFMTEAVIAHGTMNRRDATTLAVELLTAVQISNPAERLNRFPHELSGGMLQRVMIASALMGSPRLVLADEPTTALDVTTQAEVMAILDELRRERGLAMVFITHDLELAAAVCDRTAVMYAGQIVEINTSRHIEHDPLHPYTSALLRSRPRIDVTLPRLEAIPGQPLSSFEAPDDACAFAGRCPHAADACQTAAPPLVTIDGGASRCARVDELRGTLHGVDA